MLNIIGGHPPRTYPRFPFPQIFHECIPFALPCLAANLYADCHLWTAWNCFDTSIFTSKLCFWIFMRSTKTQHGYDHHHHVYHCIIEMYSFFNFFKVIHSDTCMGHACKENFHFCLHLHKVHPHLLV